MRKNYWNSFIGNKSFPNNKLGRNIFLGLNCQILLEMGLLGSYSIITINEKKITMDIIGEQKTSDMRRMVKYHIEFGLVST